MTGVDMARTLWLPPLARNEDAAVLQRAENPLSNFPAAGRVESL
jgi:hypothetical protein